ncbi:ribosomal-protein-alanine N-acetyltransferase [Peribacillus frigoritolerans]|jgi:ribosomal-protein-alanine N-acetyltransferase|uniref:GNAT family N-acetyltransferase n=1 Tax=Peribacillus frigoritolerans TaxID=450367 RepID=UPI000BBA222E|nr:GNAT family N-acetyltransferase [Peribacillus frigoritolerans]MCP1494861.1 ribosomal-protein-alanine N-acetyltransferase [Peribacillus frigoritolerans]PCD06800.1 GNAT family N-acetyltransferase [Peribacillus simplex]
MWFKELETERLHLIEIGHHHAESLFEILSKDEVTKYDGMESLTIVEDARRLIDSFKSAYINKRGMRWGVILKDSGKFIGTVGLHQLSLANKRAEIGYEIHPEYWRKHFTSEAVNEVLRYCFEELRLNRIAALTFKDNIASRNLLKKFGFKEEGSLRSYLFLRDQSHDALVFSLLNTEYCQLRQQSVQESYRF